MEWINNHSVLIVGLGLIGGSYAKALKRIGYKILAIDTDIDAIEYALENEIIDDGSTVVNEEMLKKADCVIIALYPSKIVDWVKENQRFLRDGAIITDVTGVKSSVIYDIQDACRDEIEFIAAHPMAGKEVYGVVNSDDRIFRDANYIVVPTEKNTKAAIKWCEDLGRILGFRRVSVLSPMEHDKMIGYVSQLTHCIAVALMTCEDNEHLCDYCGDSFRDLTRIANINEDMWTELFFMNKEPLIDHLQRFINEMTVLKDYIENTDAEGLKGKMRLSTKRRKLFNK